MGLPSSFFLIETQSITGQKFSKCLKNGSDRLPKGNLRLQVPRLVPRFMDDVNARQLFPFFLNLDAVL